MSFGVLVLELWGSHVSGSLALLGDAVHILSDSFVYGVAIWASILKKRELSEKNTINVDNVWGKRIANILIAIGVLIGGLAISRLISNPFPEIESGTMLGVALAGLFANFFIFWVLWCFHIEHSHPHEDNTHHDAEDKVHKGALWHIITDTSISVVVVCVAGVMIVFPETNLSWLDSLATILISLFLIYLSMKMKNEINKRTS